jgi:rhodanese-related sulfurtransferase
MIKILILIFVVLSIIPFIPYAYRQYAIWDVSNARDDGGYINQVLESFTPRIGVGEAQQAINLRVNPTIIDIRDKDVYERAHIANAISIPENQLYKNIVKKIPDKQTTIYIYCDDYYCGGVGTRLLRSMGYNNSYNLLGGIEAWKKAGYNIEEYLY